MTYTIIDIKNEDHLNDELLKLQPVRSGFKRLYRGQTSDYYGTIIPSFYRGSTFFNKQDYCWKLSAQRIIKEEILGVGLKNKAEQNSHSVLFPMNGLIQHYGLRSNGLDVTDDVNVALWFSQHKRIEKEAIEQAIIDQNKPPQPIIFKKATYVLSELEFVYLYIFDCPIWISGQEPSNGDCVDLNKWFSKYASRPTRQKAWYIYADNVNVPYGDLKSFVNIAFRIPINVSKAMVKLVDTNHYFPLPTEDNLYRRLLNSYFMLNDSNVMERIIDIPEYYNSIKDFFPSSGVNCYTEAVRFTSFSKYFETFISRIPKEQEGPFLQHENKKWLIRDATLIKMEIPDWHVIVTELNSEGEFYLPKLEDIHLCFDEINYSYFIELSKHEMVAQKNPEDKVLRGVWVVQENDNIGIELYFYSTDGFLSYPVVWYSKTILGLKISKENNFSEEQESFYNNALCNVLRAIQTYVGINYFPKYTPFRLAYGQKVVK